MELCYNGRLSFEAFHEFRDKGNTHEEDTDGGGGRGHAGGFDGFARLRLAGGWGLGIGLGLPGGAIIGGAIASNPIRMAITAGPAITARAMRGGPYGPCYWQRQRYWDGYGWAARNVRVCE